MHDRGMSPFRCTLLLTRRPALLRAFPSLVGRLRSLARRGTRPLFRFLRTCSAIGRFVSSVSLPLSTVFPSGNDFNVIITLSRVILLWIRDESLDASPRTREFESRGGSAATAIDARPRRAKGRDKESPEVGDRKLALVHRVHHRPKFRGHVAPRSCPMTAVYSSPFLVVALVVIAAGRSERHLHPPLSLSLSLFRGDQPFVTRRLDFPFSARFPGNDTDIPL